MNLRAELWLPFSPERVFPFFAEAENLEKITPPWLHFAIVSPRPIRLRQGSRIDYKLRLYGVPFRWQSEITTWEPPYRFRDEQRRGPYRKWSHTHTFVPADGGTLCLDEVEYQVPGGIRIDRWFVGKRVRAIFEFRQQALLRHFLGRAARDPELEGHWQIALNATSSDHAGAARS
jgi:ligand-binding SRPBCC domain-containing protein